MLQVKLIQSFENYDVTHAPLRSADNPGTLFSFLSMSEASRSTRMMN
jgi:hypothetical protein